MLMVFVIVLAAASSPSENYAQTEHVEANVEEFADNSENGASEVINNTEQNTIEFPNLNESDESKIAIGIKANKSQRLDYVFLTLTFINQMQLCGGTLVTSEWVLTSASCLSEYYFTKSIHQPIFQ